MIGWMCMCTRTKEAEGRMMTERDFKRRGYEERKGSRERQERKDLLDSEELGVRCRSRILRI